MEEADKRDILHDRGIEEFEKAQYRMLFTFPTGTGKSVLAIKLMRKYPGRYLLVTHTVVLHKVNWKVEFHKFNAMDLYDNLTRCCYVSLHKYDLSQFDGIIFDEAHHLSFKQYKALSKWFPILDLKSSIPEFAKKIIALTATPGKFSATHRALRRIVHDNVFHYPLEQAVEEEMLNDFQVHVIYTRLNDKDKNCLAGSKEKPFYTTEKDNYQYLTYRIDGLRNELMSPVGITKYLGQYQTLIRKRATMLYNSQTKIDKIKEFLPKLEGRTVIFARNITVAEQLEKRSFHSKSKEDNLTPFMSGKINRISSVDMLVEGMNLNDVENAVSTNPLNERKFVQTLGRILRRKIGDWSHYYVFCMKDTVEENWLKNSLEFISPERVTYEEIF